MTFEDEIIILFDYKSLKVQDQQLVKDLKLPIFDRFDKLYNT